MALRFVSLTLIQKIKSIRKMYFYNNDLQLTLISNLKEIKYIIYLIQWFVSLVLLVAAKKIRSNPLVNNPVY
jgi:hypothetical protein